MLKRTLLAGGVVLLSAWSNHVEAVSHPTGGVFDPPSPPVTPFVEELHRMPTKASLPGGMSDLSLPLNGGVAPNGTVYPQITGNDAFTTYMNSTERIVAPQQRNSGNNIQFPPKRFYVLHVRQATHVFHPDSPYNNGSIIWGYDGIFPGPDFREQVWGAHPRPHHVLICIGLIGQQIPGGIGDPRISTHLHNGHTASESDGNPVDIYPPTPPPDHLPDYPDVDFESKVQGPPLRHVSGRP